MCLVVVWGVWEEPADVGEFIVCLELLGDAYMYMCTDVSIYLFIMRGFRLNQRRGKERRRAVIKK